MTFQFIITKTSKHSKARLAELHTPHGVVQTPNFIFCGTKAAIKVATPVQMKQCGTQIILGNTYHLMLRPGADIIAQAGGLHKFTGWIGPMLTDSGGYQIFSLGYGGVAKEIKGSRLQTSRKMLKKITEEGAIFRSYVDGSTHTLSPESSVQVQQKIGADIILPLDVCTPYHMEKHKTYQAMQRSHRWEARSLATHQQGNQSGSAGPQAMYGIIQGGTYPEFREESATFVNNQSFFGQAIGGSLGQNKEEMQQVVEQTMQFINPDRPTHLLGIGSVPDIIHGVRMGIDTFDCVLPTRLARHGWALTMNESQNYKMNIKNNPYKTDFTPLDACCDCPTCTHPYSRGYIHHLFRVKEMLGAVLLTIHNVRFMNRLFEDLREQIQMGIL